MADLKPPTGRPPLVSLEFLRILEARGNCGTPLSDIAQAMDRPARRLAELGQRLVELGRARWECDAYSITDDGRRYLAEWTERLAQRGGS